MAEDYILIVEDDPELRHILSAFVNMMGFKRILASDGIEAIKRIQQYAPQLVLLDLNMPGKSGLDVLKEMREEPETRDTPVIILSTVEITTDQLADLTGPTRFIPKAGFQFSDIRGAISEMLSATTNG